MQYAWFCVLYGHLSFGISISHSSLSISPPFLIANVGVAGTPFLKKGGVPPCLYTLGIYIGIHMPISRSASDALSRLIIGIYWHTPANGGYWHTIGIPVPTNTRILIYANNGVVFFLFISFPITILLFNKFNKLVSYPPWIECS